MKKLTLMYLDSSEILKATNFPSQLELEEILHRLKKLIYFAWNWEQAVFEVHLVEVPVCMNDLIM